MGKSHGESLLGREAAQMAKLKKNRSDSTPTLAQLMQLLDGTHTTNMMIGIVIDLGREAPSAKLPAGLNVTVGSETSQQSVVVAPAGIGGSHLMAGEEPCRKPPPPSRSWLSIEERHAMNLMWEGKNRATEFKMASSKALNSKIADAFVGVMLANPIGSKAIVINPIDNGSALSSIILRILMAGSLRSS
jgi:hypothetical protein